MMQNYSPLFGRSGHSMASLSEFLRSRKFRFHPFFINHQIYIAAGLWYINTPKKWMNVFYGVYRAFVYSLITFTAINQILDIYVLLDRPGQLAEDLCAITVTLMVFTKIHILAFKSHKIEQLQQDIMRIRLSRTRPEDEEVWNRASFTIRFITKIFYALGMPCVICWIFFPALDRSLQKRVPYPIVSPLSLDQSPYYEIIYVTQSVSLFAFLFSIVSIDLTYSSYIVLIIAQMEIISRDIKYIGSTSEATETNLQTQEGKKNEAAQAVKQCIKAHNAALSQLHNLTDIYGDSNFVQMSLLSLMLAVLIVDTIMSSSGFSLKLFQRLLYTASGLFDAWIQCYWGSKLQHRSYELANEIYDSQWIEMDEKVKKMYLLMIMRAQKVPRLKCGIFEIGLPLFLEIIRYAYNAAALIMNIS